MNEFNGIPASPGMAMHAAFAHYTDTSTVPSYSMDEADIPGEWTRYQEAVERSVREIHAIKDTIAPSNTEQHQILDVQILMLHDPEMSRYIHSELERKLCNVEKILVDYTSNMVSVLEDSGDDYLAERSIDILDISRRITDQLRLRERLPLSSINREVILIAPNLLPSEVMQLDPHKIRGLVLEGGGRTSHTAILCRSLGIPAVLGLHDITHNVKPDDLIIVDGSKGQVIVSPDTEQIELYRHTLEELEKRSSTLSSFRSLPARTKGGKQISLMANIEIPEEVDMVIDSNAEGVGLFRSEFLFMNSRELPDEERQFQVYSEVLKAMDNKPVTIRTLDVGGDKFLPEMAGGEKNPLLGWRAIRFCLNEEQLFRIQLRALIRASAFGALRIMFPLISNAEEVESSMHIFQQEWDTLEAEGMARKIPIGIMIEIPSAALISDILARKVDFFSIGTNDLIQYTMAVDRDNDKVAPLYQPWHPALWRLIRLTVKNAHDAGIPVAICGEIAGDPLAAVLLTALGFDELSMSSFSIPTVKKMIRSLDDKEAENVLEQALQLGTAQEVEKLLMKKYGRYLDY